LRAPKWHLYGAHGRVFLCLGAAPKVLHLVFIIGLVVLLASAAPVASAGVNVWTAHGPLGGPVMSLTIDPVISTTLDAGTEGGGVFDLQQVHALYLLVVLKWPRFTERGIES